jgi:hypothetical protein
MTFATVVLGRLFFTFLLLAAFMFGWASLIGYPGPFILVAFALSGLPWVRVSSGEWFVAGALAALPWGVPAYLLTLYTVDGDFTIASLAAQLGVLAVLAYWFALAGQGLGKLIWRTWDDEEHVL